MLSEQHMAQDAKVVLLQFRQFIYWWYFTGVAANGRALRHHLVGNSKHVVNDRIFFSQLCIQLSCIFFPLLVEKILFSEMYSAQVIAFINEFVMVLAIRVKYYLYCQLY